MLPLLLASSIPPSIEIDYLEFAGLQIKANGIPLVQGSAFQYYETGWKRGIYSSNWRPKTIERLSNSRIRVRFQGDDGQVTGTLLFERNARGVKGTYEYRWRGTKAVKLESSFGLLWGPAFEKGSLRIDDVDALRMDAPFPAASTVEERRFGAPGSKFEFENSFAKVRIDVQPKGAIVFDARNYSQDWARYRELFWLGKIDQTIKPQETLRYEVNWDIDVKPLAAAENLSKTATLEGQPLGQALRPSAKPIPLIPQPKEILTREAEGAYMDGRLAYELSEKHLYLKDEFEASLWRRWDKDSIIPSGAETIIEGRVANLNLSEEGYRITASPGRIILTGQSEAGLRMAFRSLPWLVRARRERLEVPNLEIKDWPSLQWRGLHMFVGPTALDFHTKFMDRVFGPVKINKAVIQCERTNWNTLPGTEVNITMKREDLKELFARYRAKSIEPIPLIQSLGHTYWVFANGKNLDIAVNPDIPFTLDPRKDKTRKVLADLWQEAVTLLQPKTLHFGLDEIDMRGIPDDPSFSTRLWKLHVPWLQDLAKKHNAEPMMWGDIMLAPGEAPDATHAKTVEIAKDRRSVVRKGAWIADWHYKDDPKPESYNSLALFKSLGFKPLAATWFEPNNIYGFTHAAIRAGTPGVLQTTWAGYESSEANMVRAFEQFSAYLLAADYSWSGRKELPDKLPYDPGDVLTRLYFSPPEPVRSQNGSSLTPLDTRATQGLLIGPVAFRLLSTPARLRTPVSPEGVEAPTELVYRLNSTAKELSLAVDAQAWVADNEPLAEILVKFDDGGELKSSINYGQHARAPRDPRATLLAPRNQGISAFRLDLTEGKNQARRVTEITLRRISPAGGLRVHGYTLIAPAERPR